MEDPDAVELATLHWVARFNHHRLLERIGNIPPAETEAIYHRQLAESAMASRPTPMGLQDFRGGSVDELQEAVSSS